MMIQLQENSRTGRIVDVTTEEFFYGRIYWDRLGIITKIERLPGIDTGKDSISFITPPLVNAHVHVESSLLVPSQFGPPCLACGIGATVSDPHEIANVLGVPGVEFMLENARLTPLRIHFGAPPCVPATNSTFETSGAVLDANSVDQLIRRDDIHYLSEVMNFPGVLAGDPELLAKIASAKRLGKAVDGHAPGLRGEQALRYAQAGITTDHECVSLAEALDKISCGMKILIREGSASSNYDALKSLITTHPASVMLCSDDLNPECLLTGNIDSLCRRSLAAGSSLINVLHCAISNPVKHYGLDLGLLRVGDKADFVVWTDESFTKVQETVLQGQVVWKCGDSVDGVPPASTPNRFRTKPIVLEDLQIVSTRTNEPIIQVIDQQIVTKSCKNTLVPQGALLESDLKQDIIKLVVVSRYTDDARPACCFVKGTGLKHGAICSSVAHDSHNIIACGVDDFSIVNAINAVIGAGGGLACFTNGTIEILKLPVAGLMSANSASIVAKGHERLDLMAKKQCGSTLSAPFMTLSFLALLVIPELKLSDLGLFDVHKFAFI